MEWYKNGIFLINENSFSPFLTPLKLLFIQDMLKCLDWVSSGVLVYLIKIATTFISILETSWINRFLVCFICCASQQISKLGQTIH